MPVWEALDQAGLIARLLPEWDLVRHRPQRNAVHRYAVDRHLLEAAVQAVPLVREVHRPDLLLVGALLHDIGKGSETAQRDHSAGGRSRSRVTVATRIGFDADDVATLALRGPAPPAARRDRHPARPGRPGDRRPRSPTSSAPPRCSSCWRP